MRASFLLPQKSPFTPYEILYKPILYISHH